MKSLTEHLATYATYHRDARNIATHLVGIPTIFGAATALRARPVLTVVHGVPISPATFAIAGVIAFYVALERRFGAVMGVLALLSLAAGTALASLGTAAWLVSSLGLFVGGWAFQFVGHAYEGRKPAFVDDLVGLLIGPAFVVAEVAFFLGLRDDLRLAIEAHAGPTRATSHA